MDFYVFRWRLYLKNYDPSIGICEEAATSTKMVNGSIAVLPAGDGKMHLRFKFRTKDIVSDFTRKIQENVWFLFA